MAFAAATLRKYKTIISGANLAALGSLKIGFNGDATADVQLPANFPNAVDAAGLAAVPANTLDQLLRVRVTAVGAYAVPPQIHVERVAGPPYQIKVVNDDGTTATPNLEIEISFEHSNYR